MQKLFNSLRSVLWIKAGYHVEAFGFKEPEASSPSVWYGTPWNHVDHTTNNEIEFAQALSVQVFK